MSILIPVNYRFTIDHVDGKGFECVEVGGERLGKVANLMGDSRRRDDKDCAYGILRSRLHSGVGEEIQIHEVE